MKNATKKPKKYAEGGEVSEREKRMREQMKQEVQDQKDREAAGRAYDASLRSPEMVSPKKDKPAEKAMGGMMNSYAAGGMVKARGMGAATRGGKCKMS
jgi:hypothetical protein